MEWMTHAGGKNPKRDCDERDVAFGAAFPIYLVEGTSEPVKRGRLFFAVLSAAMLVFAAVRMTGRGAQTPDIQGDWFTTIELKGERPLEIVMTFAQASAGATPRLGEGCWTRIATRKFSVAFTLPAEGVSGSVRKISGSLVLDEAGWLRGRVSAERMDSSGRVIDSVPGLVLARPVPPSAGN